MPVTTSAGETTSYRGIPVSSAPRAVDVPSVSEPKGDILRNPKINVDIIGQIGDRGGTVVKVLCYKSEGRWFGPSWCQWIFH